MTESPGMLLSRKRIVQVAGVVDEEEARMLIACGVDLLGFPFESASGRGDVEEEAIRPIIHGLRPPVFGVVITYSTVAGTISDLCQRLGARVAQLHGDIDPDETRRLKELSPGLFVVKTLVVRRADLPRLLDEVNRFGEHVDAFLTDTFDEVTGRWGATGRTHDWSVSRRVVEHAKRPVILAGGLTPDNVQQAISDVRPAGVDVHTGVEDFAGRKDRALVDRFIRRARKAFDSIECAPGGP